MVYSSCSVVDGVVSVGGTAIYSQFNLINCSIEILEDVGTMVQPH